jgi:DNA (cytosine-5)-methyltransferase 1
MSAEKYSTIIKSLPRQLWGSENLRQYKKRLLEDSQTAQKAFKPLDKKEYENYPIQLLDFFCGAGGTSLGFAAVNKVIPAFDFLGGCDKNEISAQTYSHNYGTPLICEDIVDLAENTKKLQSLLDSIGYDPTKPTVLIGCAPCQGFTSHRKKHWSEGEDIRNNLINIFTRIVDYIQPDAVVMENVPDFLAKKYWRHFAAAKADYENNGYIVKDCIYNAASFGVPQDRFRSIVIAMKKNFVMPDGYLSPDEYHTVREAIGWLPAVKAGIADPNDPMHKSAAHKKSTLEVIRQVPHNGGSRPKGVGPVCLDKTKGFSDTYGRLYWDKPSITITHYARNPASGRYIHPEQDRGLTAREAALLQSFPIGFEFTGKSDDVYRQIGEAVPPMFAAGIAVDVLIELLSCEPTQREIADSPKSVDAPVSNSYSSVIAGMKMRRKEAVEE